MMFRNPYRAFYLSLAAQEGADGAAGRSSRARGRITRNPADPRLIEGPGYVSRSWQIGPLRFTLSRVALPHVSRRSVTFSLVGKQP